MIEAENERSAFLAERRFFHHSPLSAPPGPFLWWRRLVAAWREAVESDYECSSSP
jgi:hypothetical protein